MRELFQVKLRDFDLIVFDRFSNRGILPLGELKAILAKWWPLILILIGVLSLLKKGR